jgi:hypothetical protein
MLMSSAIGEASRRIAVLAGRSRAAMSLNLRSDEVFAGCIRGAPAGCIDGLDSLRPSERNGTEAQLVKLK